jgi:hypothetical protein
MPFFVIENVISMREGTETEERIDGVKITRQSQLSVRYEFVKSTFGYLNKTSGNDRLDIR